MKKHLHGFLISAVLCTASIQGIQAQCISTKPSSQQDKVAPSLGNEISYSDYSVELGNYSTYLLAGTPGQRYKFRSVYFYTCCPSFAYESLSSYMTITDMKDSVLATGVPPLTIATNKAQKVKVHQFTSDGCGKVIASGGAIRYVLETVLCANSYKDADGDGFGNPDSVLLACPTLQTGYVLVGNDCNDKDAKLKPTAKWYPDADGDGFGNGKATPVVSCTKPSLRTEGVDITTDSTDCDDNNVAINSNAEEILGNNVDENCDGAINLNNALDFGNSTYASVKNPTSLTLSNAFTFEFWLNPKVNTSGNIVTSQAFSLFLYAGYIYFNTGSSTSNGDLIAANKWSHIAVTYDGQFVVLYIDGVKVDQLYRNTSIGNKLQFGDNSTNGFVGKLDEVKISNKAKSSSEIMAGMNKAADLTDVNLLVYYTFDQGKPNGNNTSSTVLLNSKGQNHDADLFNFVLTGAEKNFVFGAPAFNIAPTPVVTSHETTETVNSSFAVYPNPSNGTFSITSTSELGNVSVYSSFGTMVYQNITSAKQLNIELPSKESGIYFVKVGNKMTKLVKE